MHSPKKIPQQLQRDRMQKHQKLMKLIDSYELTKQEKIKLQQLKSRTTMEINLRFLKSQTNKNYTFPKYNPQKSILNSLASTIPLTEQSDDQMDKELKQQFKKLQAKNKKKMNDYWAYDLYSQNETKTSQRDNGSRAYSTKALSLQKTRKARSLGNDKSLQKQKQGLILKRHLPLKISNERFSKSPLSLEQSQSTRSLKPFKPISLTIKQSRQKLTESKHMERYSPLETDPDKLIVDTRRLKLPQINSPSPSLSQSKVLRKLNPVHEKFKTEKHYDEQEIMFALGKKLVTEIVDPGKRQIKGVEKYLKQLQAQKKKNFHINTNNERFNKKGKEKFSQKIN